MQCRCCLCEPNGRISRCHRVHLLQAHVVALGYLGGTKGECQETALPSVRRLGVECLVTIEVTRVRFPADAFFAALYPVSRGCSALPTGVVPSYRQTEASASALSSRGFSRCRVASFDLFVPSRIPWSLSTVLFASLCLASLMWTNGTALLISLNCKGCNEGVRLPVQPRLWNANRQQYHLVPALRPEATGTRLWSSGRIPRCHRGDPGSIPGRRIFCCPCGLAHNDGVWLAACCSCSLFVKQRLELLQSSYASPSRIPW